MNGACPKCDGRGGSFSDGPCPDCSGMPPGRSPAPICGPETRRTTPSDPPKILDVYGGEGGAGQGYRDAGWSPYAVDSDPSRLKHYPGPTQCGDALEVLATLYMGGKVDFHHKDGTVEWLGLDDFAAIHASPPCTGYSQGTVAIEDRETRYPRLISVTRDFLIAMGLPYVIENVERAKPELRDPIMLCGRMFDLKATDTDGTTVVLDRHRLFESNLFLMAPPHMAHDTSLQVAGAYGGARRDKVEARTIRKGGYVPADLGVLRALLGTPWMTEKGCFLSIPPAYSQFIGEQMLSHVVREAA